MYRTQLGYSSSSSSSGWDGKKREEDRERKKEKRHGKWVDRCDEVSRLGTYSARNKVLRSTELTTGLIGFI